MAIVNDYKEDAKKTRRVRLPQKIKNYIKNAEKITPDISLTRESSEDMESEKSLEDLQEELDSLIGLMSVKKEISSLINLLKVNKIRKEKRVKYT